jgi:hypothetical protein
MFAQQTRSTNSRKTFTKKIQIAVCAWYREQRGNISDDVLQRLFPGMKLASIRTKLSQWKGRGGSQ